MRDLAERVLSLREKAEALQEKIEAASIEARKSLAHFPKLKRLEKRSIASAARHQEIACHLGQRLAGMEAELRDIEDVLFARPADDPELAGVREDVAATRQIIQAWSTRPDDGADADGDDGGDDDTE